jgi:hypothetical protein
MAKRKKTSPVVYTSRDYTSIREDLLQFAKRYYPESFQDFNESSFGSIMVDTVAYVGDILSFYLDYQTNESLLDTAIEYNNVVRLSRQLGYKFQGKPTSSGIVTLYCIIPANSIGLGPDSSYFPILKKNTAIKSKNGVSFLLEEDVRFDNPNNEIVAARIDETTGTPTSYAVKAYGKVISGILSEETVSVGEFEKFKKISLSSRNISEILSVIDLEGNEYFEVDYLSQNVIFKDVANRGVDKDTSPSILKPYIVPRRYVVEQIYGQTILQFGYGSDSELADPSVAEPSNVVLKKHGKDYISDFTFDPSKLLSTDKFGVGPANTRLVVKYRTNNSRNSNAAASSITVVSNPIVEFNNPQDLNNSTAKSVRSSIECFNEAPVTGDVSPATSEELRIRTKDNYATQNRAVTTQDYKSVIYALPQKYGAIKRCQIVRDMDSFKRNVNVYLLSEDQNGYLTMPSQTLKNNLKVWLGHMKMVNDTVDLIDGKIINIGIDFRIATDKTSNRFEILDTCTKALKDKYLEPLDMGQPIYLNEIYATLNRVRGVVDTEDVKITVKRGSSYSTTTYSVEEGTSSDGREIMAPLNAAFEIKFSDLDIKGTIR